MNPEVFAIPRDPLYQLYHRFDPSLYGPREIQLAEAMRGLQRRHRGIKLWAMDIVSEAKIPLLGFITPIRGRLPHEVIDIILRHLFISWLQCTGKDFIQEGFCHVFRPCRYCKHLRCSYCDVKYYWYHVDDAQQCNCVRRPRRSQRIEQRRTRTGRSMHDWPHQAPMHAAFPLLYPDD